ncbi:hypothetical protein AB0F71_16905 [Kitasatospora sp. NPDC028055]|uniref:hypothetical protein n=1 Tax=Kitasatospora sp. NPDC028055 TaxID=3155653 RepID=UPI0033C611CD
MSPHSGTARAPKICVLLLALPLLGATPAAAAAPAGVRPVSPCGEAATQAHHRPLPPPALVIGGPVRRGPARPCL